jgi:hypothetical protein
MDTMLTWAHGAVVVNLGGFLILAFWAGAMVQRVKVIEDRLKELKAGFLRMEADIKMLLQR